MRLSLSLGRVQDLLRQWEGEAGYVRLVSAAVAADAMVAGWVFTRLCDSEESDITVDGQQAARILHQLKSLLYDGGVFLETATGTLTHACINGIKDRFVHVGPGTVKESVVGMGLQEEGVGRQRLLELAKEFAPQRCPFQRASRAAPALSPRLIVFFTVTAAALRLY